MDMEESKPVRTHQASVCGSVFSALSSRLGLSRLLTLGSVFSALSFSPLSLYSAVFSAVPSPLGRLINSAVAPCRLGS